MACALGLVACGVADAGRAPATGGAAAASPGPRLVDGVVPVSYDLTLELDPERGGFTGHVAIAIDVAAPGTTELWLHAAVLEISRAQLQVDGRTEAMAVIARPAAPQLRGFRVAHPIAAGRVTLVLDYTGYAVDRTQVTGKVEEGLFRERHGDQWYLYSQAESVFARRITPCFDEPRWKPAWRVTTVVPAGDVALANAPMVSDRARSDGRHEIRFAEQAAMPSYLLAVAVGPFDLVDLGKRGRGHVPVRIAVPRGEGKNVVLTARDLPRAINAVENYLGAPLPLAKLDVVGVPSFFGAMENPGLITVHASMLSSGDQLISTLAHELAHQWFGDVVTPSWWDQLWLSEAFATWLGSRVTAQLEEPVAPEIAHHRRAQAIAADEAVDAAPLVRAIVTDDDIEATFDAIAYEKGAAVLAMFEQFVGPQVFRRAAQAYVAGHAGQSVTSQAFFDALAGVTSPQVGAALASNVDHTGTPVVELAITCGTAPAITAEVRDAVTLPVCVRYPAHPGSAETAAACMLAGSHTELLVQAAAGCPAWIVGNTGGLGYYRTVWRDPATVPPIAAMSAEERLVYGDDVAGAVRQGELAVAAALARLTGLAAAEDPSSGVAALAIARAVSPLVDAATYPAWRTWLGRRFARYLSPDLVRMSRYRYTREMGGQLPALVSLVGDAAGPATVAAARGQLLSGTAPDLIIPTMLSASAPGSAVALERILSKAASPSARVKPGEPLELLAWFPGGYAPRIVDLVLDPQHVAGDLWPAVRAQLGRGETRSAAWHAVHARFAALAAALPPEAITEAIDALSALCTQTERAELSDDATRWISRLAGGHHTADVALQRALATIDRCIARRAAAGDVAAALAGP